MEGLCFPNRNQQNAPVELPIIDQRAEILDTIRANQVVLLSGPTGCGKSTQVPQFILDQYAGLRKPVNILVTQPRKIAASSVARRVCKERGWILGGLVGYQVILCDFNKYSFFLKQVLNMCKKIFNPYKVGLDKENRTPDTKLLYVTTGILKASKMH